MNHKDMTSSTLDAGVHEARDAVYTYVHGMLALSISLSLAASSGALD